MSNFFWELIVLIGGVFGMGVGFAIIVFVFLILALPFMLMYWSSQTLSENREKRTNERQNHGY